MKTKTKLICFLALCGVINIVGSIIALFLHLPIYLDTIGTILAAAITGPIYGMIPGLLSGIIGFLTTDPFALYYIPVQLAVGIMTGLIFSRIYQKKRFLPLGAAAITLPGTILSSIITVLLFGGITSSGSSLFVQLFHQFGLNLTLSVVLVQLFTDYLDRFLALTIVLVVYSSMPKTLFHDLRIQKKSSLFSQKI